MFLTSALGAALAGVVTGTPPPDGIAETYAPRRVALLIGIDTYEDPSLQGLRYAAKDAEDMARVLQDPQRGGFDEVVLLTGRVERQDLYGALEHASDSLERDDTLVVFYAGHGTLESDGVSPSQLYLLTSEARLDRAWQTGVSLAGLEERLGEVRARRRIVIFDTCHSGQGRSALSPQVRAVKDSLRGPLPQPEIPEIRTRYEARLYSAHYHQPAIEDPALENGVYTHFLVEALDGAGDLDGDGLVDLMEAHTYARDATLVRTQSTQEPWYQVTEIGREPVVLSGRAEDRQAAERAILVTQPGPWYAQAYALVVDGIPRGPGAIEPGRHTIEVWDRAALVSETTRTLEARDRVDVAALVAERQRWLALTATAGVRPPSLVQSPGLVGLDGWWQPRDPQGARALLGLHASWGLGPAAELGTMPSWSAPAPPAGGGGHGAIWGPARVTAGTAWRRKPPDGETEEGHTEVAPVLGAGLYGQWRRDPWVVGLQAEWLWLVWWPDGAGTDPTWVSAPTLTLSVGRSP